MNKVIQLQRTEDEWPSTPDGLPWSSGGDDSYILSSEFRKDESIKQSVENNYFVESTENAARTKLGNKGNGPPPIFSSGGRYVIWV